MPPPAGPVAPALGPVPPALGPVPPGLPPWDFSGQSIIMTSPSTAPAGEPAGGVPPSPDPSPSVPLRELKWGDDYHSDLSYYRQPCLN